MALIPLLFSIAAWGQTEKIVTGKVTSLDDGGGLPGVNVVVQGTAKGVTTDAEGNYSIQLTPVENTLVFTFVGYKTVTVVNLEKTLGHRHAQRILSFFFQARLPGAGLFHQHYFIPFRGVRVVAAPAQFAYSFRYFMFKTPDGIHP